MIVPDYFKYNFFLSLIIFSLIAFFLLKKINNFSYSTSTISKSILLINNRNHRLIFRINFIIKSLLELGFAFYIIQYFNMSNISLLSLLLITSAIIFGFLAYFIEGKYTLIHEIIVYSYILFWTICQILISQLIGEKNFIFLTFILAGLNFILSFAFLIYNKTNVFIQIICGVILFSWQLILVIRYL